MNTHSLSSNLKATKIPLSESYSRSKEDVSSVRELPAVGWFLANVLEDYGLLNFLGLLIAEPTAASSLS